MGVDFRLCHIKLLLKRYGGICCPGIIGERRNRSKTWKPRLMGKGSEEALER
jgi:hypothetical protein